MAPYSTLSAMEDAGFVLKFTSLVDSVLF